MKNKFVTVATGVATKIKSVAINMAPAATTLTLMATNYIATANKGQQLMTQAITLLAKVSIALAVIFVVMGVIHYASASSEGDGPAKNKAMMQIAAGVMIAVLSAVLTADPSKFTDLIDI